MTSKKLKVIYNPSFQKHHLKTSRFIKTNSDAPGRGHEFTHILRKSFHPSISKNPFFSFSL